MQFYPRSICVFVVSIFSSLSEI